MNKYDRMIEMNRERSDEKIASAKLADVYKRQSMHHKKYLL